MGTSKGMGVTVTPITGLPGRVEGTKKPRPWVTKGPEGTGPNSFENAQLFGTAKL
jgi:hypothetical protein